MAGGCGEEAELPTDLALAHLRHWVPYRAPAGLFFLHRFELREVDAQRVLPDWGKTHVSSTPDLPAVNLDQEQAWRVARAYLGRLPSLDEWRYAVGGDIGFRFPWGDREPNPSYANTSELRLLRRTRVGTFESGRDLSGQGCYDLIGNVAEWTSTPLALHPLAIRELPSSFARQRESLRSAESLLSISPFLAGVVPWMPELVSPLESRSFRYCTVGFSYAESLRVVGIVSTAGPLVVESYWDDQGARPRSAEDSSSQLGLRLATDPYTFLARLESRRGPFTDGDLAALELFLGTYRMDFERVANLRAQMDREALGLTPLGELAREAWRILGVQP